MSYKRIEKMAVVFLYDNLGTLIALDATTQVERNRSASLTKSTVQDGSVIADHYHSDLPVISFSGLITDSKIRDVTPSVGNFADLVDGLIESAQPFTLYGTNDGGIPDMENAMITSFNIVRGAENLNSLEVAITCEQIDISKTAKKDGITLPAKSTEGQLDSEKNAGVGTKTEPEVKYTQAKLKEIKDKNPPVGDGG